MLPSALLHLYDHKNALRSIYLLAPWLHRGTNVNAGNKADQTSSRDHGHRTGRSEDHMLCQNYAAGGGSRWNACLTRSHHVLRTAEYFASSVIQRLRGRAECHQICEKTNIAAALPLGHRVPCLLFPRQHFGRSKVERRVSCVPLLRVSCLPWNTIRLINMSKRMRNLCEYRLSWRDDASHEMPHMIKLQIGIEFPLHDQ
jgi:hypothetical protein